MCFNTEFTHLFQQTLKAHSKIKKLSLQTHMIFSFYHIFSVILSNRELQCVLMTSTMQVWRNIYTPALQGKEPHQHFCLNITFPGEIESKVWNNMRVSKRYIFLYSSELFLGTTWNIWEFWTVYRCTIIKICFKRNGWNPFLILANLT